MHYFTHSEAQYNRGNEDSIAVQAHSRDARALLCVLADGQGGQAGAATASQIAVQACLEAAAHYAVAQLLDPATWNAVVRVADEAVHRQSGAGFTTLIGLCVADNRICGASCGDSAALLVRYARYAELTARQRKNPPVGSRAALPTPFTARFEPGSKLLIMSDGVWKGVGYDAIAELGQAKQGRELIMAARHLQVQQHHGQLPDDFSLIVVY